MNETNKIPQKIHIHEIPIDNYVLVGQPLDACSVESLRENKPYFGFSDRSSTFMAMGVGGA
jgi:hypothetical protein